MKNSNRLQFLLLLGFLSLTRLSAGQELPQIIAIRELELTPGTNEIVFQNYYNKWCRNIKLNTKGVSAWIMKGYHGARNGKYDMVWGFNYMETRDYYFPVSDITNYPKWNAALDRFQFQAPPEPLVEDINDYTDFVVVGYDQMLNPKLGEMISITYPEVKPGKEKELEEFVAAKFNNAFQDNVDGYFVYLLKGNRGEFKGRYAILRIFDTFGRRKLYFPDDTGKPSQALIKARKQISSTMEKFQSYFASSPIAGSEDFVVLY